MTEEQDNFRENHKKAFMDYLESDGEIEFDLYAQDSNIWLWLQEYIPGIIISSAGGIAPFQAEGLLEGLPFYYRDRHGYADLKVGSVDGGKPYGGEDVYYSSSCETGEFGGLENFLKNIVTLVKKLKPSPFCYEFRGLEINYLNDGSHGYEVTDERTYIQPAWGFTSAEAFAKLREPSPYLESVGWSKEFQLEIYVAHDFDTEPVNKDERIYPEDPVVFRVNA